MGGGRGHAKQSSLCDSSEQLRRRLVVENGQAICQIGDVLEARVQQHFGSDCKHSLHHGSLHGPIFPQIHLHNGYVVMVLCLTLHYNKIPLA